jgi:hypothetical protein
MRKYVYLGLLVAVAMLSYLFMEDIMYRDVIADFKSQNPGCLVLSVKPLSKKKGNVYYVIRYRRKGEERSMEQQWLFQEGSSRWEKTEGASFGVMPE